MRPPEAAPDTSSLELRDDDLSTFRSARRMCVILLPLGRDRNGGHLVTNTRKGRGVKKQSGSLYA
jgi:hypothetical protein